MNQPGENPQHLLEKKLIESASRFRSIIEFSSIPMCFYTGANMKIEVINDALLETWGKDKSVVGKTLKEVFPELKEQSIFSALIVIYQTGEPCALQSVPSKIIVNGETTDYYHDLWCNPVKDAEGKVYGILVSGVNVTDKVISRKKIQESELRFRTMVENATVAIGLTRGRDMIFENINEPMMEMINRTQEVIGKPLLEVLPELKGQQVMTMLYQTFDVGKPHKGTEIPAILVKNNIPHERYYNISYIPLYENDTVTYILHVAIDVTENVVARKKIESAEVRTRLAIESAELGTYEINLLTNEMQTSKRFDSIWGIKNKTTSRDDFISFIHPADRAKRDQAHLDSITSGRIYYEARVTREDGSLRWVKVNGMVLYDTNKRPHYLLGVIQDITEQKNLQQQKDNFMAMASHELKTPLTSIKAYTQIIKAMLLEHEKEKEAAMITKMDAQINKLSNLIGDLLNITNIQTGRIAYKRDLFNFNELIAELTEELQPTTQRHILNMTLDAPAQLYGDRDRIGQVIINLISNAIKYSPEATVINISTRISGNDVIFCVEDFGIGINEGEIGYVFDQFYRVNNIRHQSFPGLGLGLYIAASITKNEGGKIWANSKENEGSRFYFSLPVATS